MAWSEAKRRSEACSPAKGEVKSNKVAGASTWGLAFRRIECVQQSLREGVQVLEILPLKGPGKGGKYLKDSDQFLLAQKRNHHHGAHFKTTASLRVDPGIGLSIFAVLGFPGADARAR